MSIICQNLNLVSYIYSIDKYQIKIFTCKPNNRKHS